MKPLDPQSKIMDLSEAVAWRGDLRRRGETLVVSNGCFDLLHRGHISYLQSARERGDALLLLINGDESIRKLKGAGRPLVAEEDRAYTLAALASVDAVVMFSSPRCTEQFRVLRPDIYIKGGDYSLATINVEEKSALLELGARIEFIPFVPGFSTSELIEKIRKLDC